MLARQRVQHQVEERRRRDRDQRGVRPSLPRGLGHQRVGGSCSWRGAVGALPGPQGFEPVEDPAVDGAEPVEPQGRHSGIGERGFMAQRSGRR